ncbi:hypothetical protein U1Q18_008500 [Sarracenia purpurea var. burkii]
MFRSNNKLSGTHYLNIRGFGSGEEEDQISLRRHRRTIGGIRHNADHSAALYGTHTQVDFLLSVVDRPSIVLMHLEMPRTSKQQGQCACSQLSRTEADYHQSKLKECQAAQSTPSNEISSAEPNPMLSNVTLHRVGRSTQPSVSQGQLDRFSRSTPGRPPSCSPTLLQSDMKYSILRFLVQSSIAPKRFFEYLQGGRTAQLCLYDPILTPRSGKNATKMASIRMRLGGGERTTSKNKSEDDLLKYRERNFQVRLNMALPQILDRQSHQPTDPKHVYGLWD